MMDAPKETELAGRWKRLGGSLLDTVISMAISVPVMIFSGIYHQISSGQPMTTKQQLLFSLFGMAVFLLLNGYFLARDGQTLGKKIIGTRIVSYIDAQILPLGRVFTLRYLPLTVIMQIPFLGNVFSLLDCLFIFRKDKRCIHDLIAGTKVVNA